MAIIMRVKGGQLASAGKNEALTAWWGTAALSLCLLVGCSPRQPAVDLYLDAVALRELGQNALAVEKLDAVVKADPDFAPAYLELGKAYRALRDDDKAMAAFQQAAQLDAWSFEHQLELAKCCRELGKYPQAANAYVRAAELDPKSLEAQMGAAECYLKMGEYAKSLTYCELAEKGGAKPQEVLPLLACAYEGQKDHERAIQAYRRLLTLDDDNPNVLLSLGVAYMRAGQYDRAREALVSAAQVGPENGVVFRHLGYCLIRLEQVEQAIQMYQKSVDLDANDWEAHRGLGVACMIEARQTADAHMQEQALRYWRRSLAIKPDQPKHEVLEKLIREHSKLQNPLQGLNY
ncbi:MAG: hypothetical protein A2Y76_06105 [Planctomycetes bacterium RBG_13_60_9]|nr:MAG: hypothetical protein A2Y76_06105 [Planctomycetes bacterium RBG_13_60_9]